MFNDPLFWQSEKARLAARLFGFVAQLAQLGAMAAAQNLRSQGLNIDTTPGNQAAAQWARQYTDDLLNLLGSTNEKVVGEVVAGWIETPGATRQDLIDQLKPLLENNEYRADMIGTTEVTRATNAGDALMYESAGIGKVVFPPPGHVNCRCFTSPKRYRGVWVIVWETDRDEVVCTSPISTPWGVVEGCHALQNVVISEGDYLGQKI